MKRYLKKSDKPGTGKSESVENRVYSRVVDTSRSMISVINRNYRYERVNRTFTRAHKIPSGKIIGKTPGDLWGREAFERSIKPNIDRCFSGKTVKYEASFDTPLSGKRFFEVSFRPVRTAKGKITHLIAETHDVTSLISSQKATSELKKELRRMELDYEKRLLYARKLEALGVLAGGIAHDFNNILATVSGYTEMLLEDLPEESPSSHKARQILNAVGRARSLTEQILTFSRQGKQKKEVTSVGKILKESIEFVRAGTPPQVIIRTEIISGEVNVMADPAQLFRIFLNLMTNALQAMEGKAGSLSVGLSVVNGSELESELRKEKVAPRYALITFRDTGSGIDRAVMQKIFDPFFTTREIGKGTGLGLSVVHGTVSDMDGEIFVSSRKNKGTLFRLLLPVVINKIQ